MTAMAAPVAIVTGAGQGIGRAAALALAGRGRHVVVADRDPATGAETVARVAAAGGSASLAAVDVTDPAAVDAMAAAVLARHGAIDALVTCARWTGLVPTPVAEIADADWRRAMDVNVTGTFNCVRAVVPSMSARRRGRIVILSSATVTLPPAASTAAIAAAEAPETVMRTGRLISPLPSRRTPSNLALDRTTPEARSAASSKS